MLALVSFVKQHEAAPKQIDLVGLDGMGAVAAVAAAQARGILDRVVVDTRGFRFGKLESFRDPDFLPGGAKYGDLPGIMALIAPAKLWVAGEAGDSPALIRAAYASAQRPQGRSKRAWKVANRLASKVFASELLRSSNCQT